MENEVNGYQPLPAPPGARVLPPPRDPSGMHGDNVRQRDEAILTLQAMGFTWDPLTGWTPGRDALPTPYAPFSPGHTINANGSVAVATGTYWDPMSTCPVNVKVQLLGDGGVAVYAKWDGRDKFWTGWAPVPRRRPE